MSPEQMTVETPAPPAVVTPSPARVRPAWLALLIAAAVVLLYSQVLYALVEQWWDDPNYSHGFFIPIFSAFLLWERRDSLAKIKPAPSNAGLVLLVSAIGVLFIGSLGADLFLTRVSLLIAMAGLIVYLHGPTMLRALAFPLGVLLLAIPLPAIIYNQIVLPLQLLASQMAASILQDLHILPVYREGNVLVLPNMQLEVAEACSGIRSLVSLLSLSVIYGYFAERRALVRVLLCLLIVPIAVLGNAARVMFDAAAAVRWGESALDGTPHTVSGIVLFLVATLCLLGAHKLIVLFWRDSSEVKP